MLPQQNRLKKKKDFERVFKKGKPTKGSFLLFKIVENELGVPRFGFIIPSKVLKKAVERNKLKRRLRHIVREFLPQIEKGIDGVFVALPQAKGKEFEEVKKEVKNIFQKMKIIKNEES